jgi:hypothetical protein
MRRGMLPGTYFFPGTTKPLYESSCGGLALDLGQDLSHNEQDIPRPA